MTAYEFACEHLFAGCTTRIKGETKDAVAKRAAEHLRDHHDFAFAEAKVNAEMWQAIVRLRS